MAGMLSLRMQEVVAGLMAFVFFGICAFAGSHCWGELVDLRQRAKVHKNKAEDLLSRLRGRPIDMAVVTDLERQIDEKGFAKGMSQQALTSNSAEYQRLLSEKWQDYQRSHQVAYEARANGLAGAFPWSPGPEPDWWFNWYDHGAWKGRNYVCSLFNDRMSPLMDKLRLHDQKFSAVEHEVAALKKQVAGIELEVQDLRVAKNAIQAIIADPSSLVIEPVRESLFTRFAVVLIHAPMVGYALLLGIRFSYRFLLMRGLGRKILCT